MLRQRGWARRLIRQGEHRLRQPAAEGLIVGKQLEQLCIVLEDAVHDAPKGTLEFDARVLLVRVFHRILIRRVGCHSVRDIPGDEPVNSICVVPRDVAELIVEGPQDVGEAVNRGFRLTTAG